MRRGRLDGLLRERGVRENGDEGEEVGEGEEGVEEG